MKKCVKVFLLSVLVTQVAFAQDRILPADSYFYEPVIGKEIIVISESNGTDDSNSFREAIKTLNQKGGGVLRVKNGTYHIAAVYMKSNVHIRVKAGVIFKPVDQRTDLFTTPMYYTNPKEEPVNNFSIEGEGGNFLVDFTSGTERSWMSFVSVRSGYNFRLANFIIEDNFTPLSSLTLGPVVDSDVDLSDPENPLVDAPSKGILENIGVIHEHFGYGLIQIQAGSRILFRNLWGIGGTTLRLETGLNKLQLMKDLAPRLDDVYARDISCTNGHCAVMLGPHTMKQGVVDVRGVKAFSCGSAVSIGRGHVSQTRPGQNDPKLGLAPGWFDPSSVVEDVVAIFGQDAQLKTQHFINIPCELKGERKNGEGIVSWRGSEKIHIGPSVAAVSYKSVNVLDNSEDRPIDFREHSVKAYGFSDKLPANAVIREGEYEFKDCPDTKY